ncbi:hypothetical protein CSOJ01_05410 [Colletotrichum sojae]|uniref:Uncharacterized protein n=1 Tax=Colletotrichum sojae TaxID=2175907 RepID=A0A8H6JFF9_9PEZI|nr:hypothetical protein CSOJ01_05410 [Colletotrichum sojae]
MNTGMPFAESRSTHVAPPDKTQAASKRTLDSRARPQLRNGVVVLQAPLRLGVLRDPFLTGEIPATRAGHFFFVPGPSLARPRPPGAGESCVDNHPVRATECDDLALIDHADCSSFAGFSIDDNPRDETVQTQPFGSGPSVHRAGWAVPSHEMARVDCFSSHDHIYL